MEGTSGTQKSAAKIKSAKRWNKTTADKSPRQWLKKWKARHAPKVGGSTRKTGWSVTLPKVGGISLDKRVERHAPGGSAKEWVARHAPTWRVRW